MKVYGEQCAHMQKKKMISHCCVECDYARANYCDVRAFCDDVRAFSGDVSDICGMQSVECDDVNRSKASTAMLWHQSV